MKTVNKLLISAMSPETIEGKAAVRSSMEGLSEVVHGTGSALQRDIVTKQAQKTIAKLKLQYRGNVSLEAAASDLLLKLANVDGPQTSMEGLGEFFKGVRHFFSSKKPGEKIKDTKWGSDAFNKALAEVNKSINNFYTKDSWLNSQYFVTEDIKCSDFIKRLAIGDSLGKDVYKDVLGFEAPFKKLHSGYVDQCNDYVQALSEAFNAAYNKQHAHSKTGGGAERIENKEAEKTILAEFLADVAKIKVPAAASSPTSYIGSYVLTAVAGKPPTIKQASVTGDLPSTLPALTKEQVKELGKVMLTMGKWVERSYFLFIEMFVEEEEYFQTNWLKYHPAPEELEKIGDAGVLWHTWQSGVFDLYANLFTVMGALESWIDRSIK